MPACSTLKDAACRQRQQSAPWYSDRRNYRHKKIVRILLILHIICCGYIKRFVLPLLLQHKIVAAMKFKVGDKVLFLNEKGGGIVTRIVDEEIVHVSVDDGFEIPYAVGDLIRTAHDEREEPSSLASIKSPSVTGDHRHSPLQLLPHQSDGIRQGIYLAMVPRNQDRLLFSVLDFYVVNHTTWAFYFGLFMNRSGHFHGVMSDMVLPGYRRHVKKVERNDIEEWNHSLMHGFFYKEGKTEVTDPVSAHIIFKPVKIYKEESFAFNPLLHQKAMMVNVCNIGKHGI